MAGAEELARTAPRIRDYLYSPDNRLAIDLLASGNRQRREEIARGGDILAQMETAKAAAEASKFDKVADWIDTYQRSKRGAEESRMREQEMELGGLRKRGLEQGLERGEIEMGTARAQAEESRMAMEQKQRERDYWGQIDPATGKTREESMRTAGYDVEMQKPGWLKEEHELQMAQAKKQMRVSDAQLAQAGFAIRDAREARARADAQDAMKGIYAGATTPDALATADAKAQGIAQQFSAKHGIAPEVLQGYSQVARATAQSTAAQQTASTNLARQTDPLYQRMMEATQAVDAKITQHQELTQLANQYSSYQKMGYETDEAVAAREQFAKALDARGDTALAARVRSSSNFLVPAKMREVLAEVGAGIRRDMGTVQTNFGKFTQDPQYQTLLQRAQTVPGGPRRNALDITRTGAGGAGVFTGAGAQPVPQALPQPAGGAVIGGQDPWALQQSGRPQPKVKP